CKRNGETVPALAASPGARQSRDPLRVCVRSDAAPELGADRPSGGPTFLREVDQHAGEMRVGARIKPLNWPQRRADEQRLHDHLIPGVLGKNLARIGIVVRDRLENRLHAGAHGLAGTRFDQRGAGIERKPAAERDQLVDLCAAAEAVKPCREGSVVAVMARDHEGDARELVDAPVGWIEIGPQRGRAPPVVVGEAEVGLAEAEQRILAATVAEAMRRICHAQVPGIDAWKSRVSGYPATQASTSRGSPPAHATATASISEIAAIRPETARGTAPG